MTDPVLELYRRVILQHATDPFGYGVDFPATHEVHLHNRLCGDQIHLYAALDSCSIQAIGFTGEACAICTASSSLLCQHTQGQSIETARALNQQWQQAVYETDHSGIDLPQKLQHFLTAKDFPNRQKCLLLPWQGLDRLLDSGDSPKTA